MTLNKKIERICSAPAPNGRLKAELHYAARVSKADKGKFDNILDKTCDRLIAELDRENYITDALTAEAEKMMSIIIPAAKEYTLHFVSHAHIDMNWMWGFQETSNVTLDTFRTMLRLMEEYPDFTFSQSQASTYDICEELDPELFSEIARRVKEGRWEVTASTWTEADKNIPSGESLSRHHLYTKEYMKEKFGLTSEQLCIDFEPDTFGHSAFVPEILNEGGVKYFYHCRGGELKYAYRYKAPSGAEILCYQDPYFYGNAINEHTFEVLPVIEAECGIKTGLRVYGVGDHGGGPSRRDIEMILEMQSWPITPKMIFSTYGAFFAELEKYRSKLPVIDKERNFIFTGCYSSQSRIKAGNRLCEDRMYSAEALSALSAVYTGSDSYNFNFRKAWHKILFNQFHDILPGSCIRDSREHALGNYQSALGYINSGLTKGMLSLANAIDSSRFESDDDKMTSAEGSGVGFLSGIGDRALHTAAEYGSGKTRVIHIFNPTNYERREVVRLTVWDFTGDMGKLAVYDTEGNVLDFHCGGPADYWGHRFVNIDVLASVAAYGYTTVVIKENDSDELPLVHGIMGSLNARIEEFRENVLENEYLRAEFDDDMCLVSLTDKETGREMIRDKAAYFEYYVENGRIHMPNAWSEGPAIQKINMNSEGKIFIQDTDGRCGVRQSIRYQLEFMDTKMDVDVALDKGARTLRFSVETDWHENGHHMNPIPTMRFKVPLSYGTDKYLYDIPLGLIERTPLRHDAPGHCFIFAPDTDVNRGVALFNDTQVAFRGNDNTVSSTILRASSHPDDYPEYGRHHNEIGLAVLPFDKAEIFKTAHCFVYPMPFASVRPHKGTLSLGGSLMKISGDVIISAVKTPESDETGEMIIRMYSISDKPQTVTASFGRELISAETVNTLENPLKSLKVSGQSVKLDVPAFKTVSLHVVF